MIRPPLAFALVFLLGAPSANAASSDKPRIAVLEVQTSGIDAGHAPVLTEVLTAEIDALGRFEVMASSDVQAMLGFEKQKEMVGCTDASCLAEIGGALGVSHIVVSNVGQIGDTYVVNVKLIDITKGRTERRVYETVQGKLDVVLATLRSAVEKLFGTTATDSASPAAAAATSEAPAPEAPTTPAEAAPAPAEAPNVDMTAPPAQLEEDDGPSWLTIGLWIGGGVALLGAAGLRAKAKSHADNADDRDYVGAQREIEKAEGAQRGGFGLLGLGLALAGAGFFTWTMDF